MNIKETYIYAKKAHKEQKWAGEPYIKHLEEVTNTLMEYLKLSLYKKVDLHILKVGYLHDVVEDTDKTISNIIDSFGANIANDVSLLSYNNNTSKEEYFKDISKSVPATYVKLADRLVNLIKTNETGHKKLIKKYLDEHIYVKKYLFGLDINLDNAITNEINQMKP